MGVGMVLLNRLPRIRSTGGGKTDSLVPYSWTSVIKNKTPRNVF